MSIITSSIGQALTDNQAEIEAIIEGSPTVQKANQTLGYILPVLIVLAVLNVAILVVALKRR